MNSTQNIPAHRTMMNWKDQFKEDKFSEMKNEDPRSLTIGSSVMFILPYHHCVFVCAFETQYQKGSNIYNGVNCSLHFERQARFPVSFLFHSVACKKNYQFNGSLIK